MTQQVLIGLSGIREPLERETVSSQAEMNVVLESRDGGSGGGRREKEVRGTSKERGTHTGICYKMSVEGVLVVHIKL